MNAKYFTLLCLCLASQLAFAQHVFVPPGFEGPIFFDATGLLLKNQTGAYVYRIYRVSGVEDEVKLNQLSANERGVSQIYKHVERSEYFYFEDHFMSGDIQVQGNMWVTKQHKEQGISLLSWDVHLLGQCKWYHKNGQLAQIGIYDGADLYGEEKQFDPQGKLTKVKVGNPLSAYKYNFERGVLKIPDFVYTDDNGILPKPQGSEEEGEALAANLEPINLAAKMAAMPHFAIKSYRPYLGLYQGKTTNLALKKVTNTNLEIREFVSKEDKVMMEIHWYGSFSAYTELAGSINDNVIFAQGDWFVKGVKVGNITMAAFFQKEEGRMEGFFNVKLFAEPDKVQSCSFTLVKN